MGLVNGKMQNIKINIGPLKQNTNRQFPRQVRPIEDETKNQIHHAIIPVEDPYKFRIYKLPGIKSQSPKLVNNLIF
jgi:hypothetical protein